MSNAKYVLIAQEISLDRRMDTIAHNMANIATPGFRATGLKFETLVSPVAENNRMKVNFTTAGRSYINTEHGAMEATGNQLDLAVKGDGYFALETPAGKAYTRDGRMQMTAEGGLVSAMGYPVLDTGGAPLQVDPQGGPLRIAANGNIYQGDVQVGTVGLFRIPPGSKLRYGPNSSVIPEREPEPVVDDPVTGVRQGFLEKANINGIVEMTRLIEVNRAFERAHSCLQQLERLLNKAIEASGRVS